MDRAINKEIFRLSIPSILANITIPLVGMVDTAIAGHLNDSAALLIGAIALGSTIFNILYWNIGFLRTGTGGLTAQAFGKGDYFSCARIFVRAEFLAIACALLLIILQIPIADFSLFCIQGSQEVESLTRQYLLIRIWAAPATFSLMAFSGWFIGMQDSMSSMWKDLIVNGVNIGASLLLAFGAGFGFRGIVWGTVIAQYSGLLFCIIISIVKYKHVFKQLSGISIKDIIVGDKTNSDNELRLFFKMNADLVGRSIGFSGIYLGYTLIATQFGDTMLACSSLLMQMLMIFSYFIDGFAYAGEALTGRFIGAGDRRRMRLSIKYIMIWGYIVAALFVGIYAFLGEAILNLLTSDKVLVYTCMEFWLWMLFMPPISCAAFLWDGVFLGATASKEIRNAMLGSMLCFLGVWYICKVTMDLHGFIAIHCLMAAYFSHLIFRTVYLTLRQKRLGVKQE